MKKTKIVLGALAAVLLGASVAMDSNGNEKIFAVGPVPEMILTPACAVLVPLLLLAICVLSLVQKVRDGESGRALLIIGVVVFGAAAVFISSVVIENKDDLDTIKKLKSPDGEHTIYYYEETLDNKYTGSSTPGVVTLRRTGFFTYEESICCTKNELDLIIWEDDGYTSFIGGQKSEYSSYGD